MKLVRITLPLREAMEACTAIFPHTSSDDVTPVITRAHITGNRMLATDRYSVAQFTLSAGTNGGDFLLSRDAVRWLATFPIKSLIDYTLENLEGYSYEVTITAPPSDALASADLTTDKGVAQRTAALAEVVTVSIGNSHRKVEQQRAFRPFFGNFPTIDRLIEGFEKSGEVPTVALNPAFIERFTGYAKKYHHNPINLTLNKPGGTGKPGPVRIAIGGKFVGLLQPNILMGANS